MKVYKYKDIEFTEVLLSELNGELRIDAEFFQSNYIDFSKLIKNTSFTQIKNFAFVTDGIHESIDFDSESKINLISAKAPKVIFFDTSSTGYISHFQHSRNPRTELQVDDIVISTVGTIGNCSIVTKEILPANSDRHIGIIRIIDKKKILPCYLTVYLNTIYGKALVMRETAGNVQLNLYIKNIKTLDIPVPPIKFQALIQDKILEAQQQKVLSDKLYKEAEEILLEELGLLHWKPKTKKFKLQGVQFEVEDTINEVNTLQVLSSDRVDSEYWLPKYEEFNNKLLINKHIEFNPLASYFTWAKGIEVGSKEYVEESKYPFIRVSNISKNGFNFQSAKYIHEETYKKLKPFHLRKGEILFSKDGTAGIALLVREKIEAITSSGILRLTNISNLPSEYFELVLNSQIVQIQIAQKISGALIHHLKVTEAMKFIIPEIKSITKVAELVNKSNHNKVSSTTNINNAIKAVELFIEEGEAAAVKFIKQKSN